MVEPFNHIFVKSPDIGVEPGAEHGIDDHVDFVHHFEVGRGSVFTFSVRQHEVTAVEPREKPEANVAPIAPVRARDVRVLVAEDNAVNQEVAIAMLGALGCRADTVRNGREAVEAVSGRHYDLVLMDIQMPEMDGTEATRLIRSRETDEGRRLPIIAVTAHALQHERREAMVQGMDDYLSKPYTESQLAAMLERWLGSESQQRN